MKQHAAYGVDAPEVVRTHIVLGRVLASISSIGFALPQPNPIPISLNIGAAFVAALLLFYAVVMLRSSLVGKKRVCDRLIAALALSGNEQVLDAGCGRGLALIGCAKNLTTGKAVGIDLWAGKDQSNNNPEATLANAAVEGVASRVEVKTGDIARLPFSDASFDAVISMTVLHNIPSRQARDEALRELVRVLKPGGRMAIFDRLHAPRYTEVLQDTGMKVQNLSRDFLWLLPCRSLLALKPGKLPSAPAVLRKFRLDTLPFRARLRVPPYSHSIVQNHVNWRISTSTSKPRALFRRASTVSDVSANNSAVCSGVMPSTTQATNTMRSSSGNSSIDRSRTSRITPSAISPFRRPSPVAPRCFLCRH